MSDADPCKRAGRLVAAASRIAVLTGAGISTESGIPDFRSPGGLWSRYDPAKLTVGVWFEGTVTGGALQAGDDAEEVGWFALDDLPELAFETDLAFLSGLAYVTVE